MYVVLHDLETRNNISSKIPSITELPIQFSYDDFTLIDQRLKSYVQHTFFREKEEFVLVFRVRSTKILFSFLY